MNILFVCSATSWGGNEKWTSMAMQALSKNHTVHFIGKEEGLLKRFNNNGAQQCLPFRSYIDVYTFKHLKQFIQKEKIDLIISTKKKEYFLCGLISRQLKTKHLMRLGVSRKMNIPFWHKLNYKTLNDGLIVNAHFIKSELRRYSFFQHHPIHVLYNGIPGFYSNDQLAERSLNNDKFVIVSSGRITKQKGYGILIEAIDLLPNTIKEKLEVRIIGEGRNKEEFERLVEQKKLNSIIRFYGFINKPTELMSDAHLFVLLSEREGISNSILEAMTIGIPVLSTNTGGISELIEDNKNGFFVERSAVAVADKINSLANNANQLQDVGKEGFNALRDAFGFDVFVKSVEELL